MQDLGLVFKRLVLVFWTVYFTSIALTSLLNLLDELGAFDWNFLDSGNLEYLRSVLELYEAGTVVTKLLLAGAFVIEGIAAALFWRALLAFARGGRGLPAVWAALCGGLLVSILFVLGTELFVAYGSESVYPELFLIMLGSAVAFVLIPDDAELGGGGDTLAA
jgi:hypothetical protein